MAYDTAYPATMTEQEWLDDLLGKGKGDPDFYGYPGEESEDE